MATYVRFGCVRWELLRHASKHGLWPGVALVLRTVPPNLMYSTTSCMPNEESKSVWFKITVRKHCPPLNALVGSKNITVSVIQPGSEQQKGYNALWFTAEAVNSDVDVDVDVVVVVSVTLRTIHVTVATPLNKFPSKGHSSTAWLIFASMDMLPSSSIKLTASMALAQPKHARPPCIPAIHAFAPDVQFCLTTLLFTVTYSTTSLERNSSKSVVCTQMLNLQCAASWIEES
mmetsp:Transcript_64087/g.169850  ORF Transcript_64087/g.169850 Transcript_64087/m.169850 type:complete len:231 (-) Transcript_64087:753-1445(-)